jgi:hypothetical protein
MRILIQIALANLIVVAITALMVKGVPRLSAFTSQIVARYVGLAQLAIGLLGLLVLVVLLAQKHHEMAEGVIIIPALFAAAAILPSGMLALGYAYWDPLGPRVLGWFLRPVPRMPAWAAGLIVLSGVALTVELAFRGLIFARFFDAYRIHNGLSFATALQLTGSAAFRCMGRVQSLSLVLTLIGTWLVVKGIHGGMYLYTVSVVAYAIGFLLGDNMGFIEVGMALANFTSSQAPDDGSLQWIATVGTRIDHAVWSLQALGVGAGWIGRLRGK